MKIKVCVGGKKYEFSKSRFSTIDEVKRAVKKYLHEVSIKEDISETKEIERLYGL